MTGTPDNMEEWYALRQQEKDARKTERASRGLEPLDSIDSNGYVRRNNKYLHRLVMEQFLNRALLKDESVHHKDGNKLNNELKNLELWSSYQPSGQRVEDKLIWAREIINRYEESPE